MSSAAALKAWETRRARGTASPRSSKSRSIYSRQTDHVPVFIPKRDDHWSFEQQDATPAQFRDMLPRAEMDAATRLAIYAGIRLAEHLAKAANVVGILGDSQIEEWRRRYGVLGNRKQVMLSVATGFLQSPWRHRQEINAAWVRVMRGHARPDSNPVKILEGRARD